MLLRSMPSHIALVVLMVLSACLVQSSLAGASVQPSGVLLLGTGTQGVYRSVDDGRTWQQASTGLPAGGIWQVQPAPALAGTAYLTTGSLFRTDDGGLHWQSVPGLATGGPGFTALAAQGSLLLAAGPNGILAGGGKRRWVMESPGLPGGAPRQLVAAGPNLLYAVGANGALYLHGPVPWGHRTVSWQSLHGGLPDAPITAFTYVPLTTRQDMPCPLPDMCGISLYAGVAGHGIWQSTDSGRTWTQETAEQGALPRSSTVRALLAGQADDDAIYAAVEGHGLYRSQHAGQFWKPAVGVPPDQQRTTITSLAAVGTTIVAATAGGGVDLYEAGQRSLVWNGRGVGLPYGALGLSLAWVPAPPPVLQPAPALPGPCDRSGAYPVCGPFLRLYRLARPSLTIFGNVLSPVEYDTVDRHLVVQYFDRARFEYRPDVPGGVRLTPLGRLLTGGRRFPITPVGGVPLVGAVFFRQTGYSISQPFLKFWRQHGGPAFIGYPISSLIYATNEDGSGRTYIMQYFENGRLEYHAEQSGTRYSIQLGLLGRIYLCHTLHRDGYCQV